ncbi:hypothetical protein RB195_024495 [Necator americanus]|uniref:UDP-glucose:glycoprotein glucosyltransferase thioredoxin-like domain-containing protein n=1 Tax=Necator americanus TaxID=51031 RepID=A0ABR1ENE3_NECAM
MMDQATAHAKRLRSRVSIQCTREVGSEEGDSAETLANKAKISIGKNEKERMMPRKNLLKDSGFDFMKRSAIGETPKVLLNGYVLDDAGVTGDKFEETVMAEVMRITPKLQASIINGQLKDRMNVGNWIMEQKDVLPRHNKLILDAVFRKNIIDLGSVSECKAKTLSGFVLLSPSEQAQCLAAGMRYLKGSEDDHTVLLTLWIIADLDTPKGLKLVHNAMRHLEVSKKLRLGIVVNPTSEDRSCQANSMSSLVHAALKLLPHNFAKQFITNLIKLKGVDHSDIPNLDGFIGEETIWKHFNKERMILGCDQIKKDSFFIQNVANILPGQRALVANGIIVGPFDEAEEFLASDIELLEKIVETRGAAVISSHIKNWNIRTENGFSSDVVMRSFALISKYAVSRKRTWIVLGENEKSTVTLVAEDPDRPVVDVVVVVDPLSRTAQKLAHILDLLRKTINCDLKIVLNPKPKLSELPLKRFYRFVAAPELQFDKSGKVVATQARNLSVHMSSFPGIHCI